MPDVERVERQSAQLDDPRSTVRPRLTPVAPASEWASIDLAAAPHPFGVARVAPDAGRSRIARKDDGPGTGQVRALKNAGVASRIQRAAALETRSAPIAVTRGADPDEIRRVFELKDKDRDDSFEYQWKGEDGTVSGTYVYAGTFPGLGDRASSDLLWDEANGRYWHIANMFGKGTAKPWNPNLRNFVDQEQLKQAEQNRRLRMTKREPAPSGEIGKMGFRFEPAEGVLYHVGPEPPAWFSATDHPDVRVLKIAPTDLAARILDFQMEDAGVRKQYLSQSKAGSYLFVQRPAHPLDPDDRGRSDRSKVVTRDGVFTTDQVDESALDAVRKNAMKLDGDVPPKPTQPVTFVREAVGMSREAGQLAAMAGMNASAYAFAFKDRRVARTTDWEWLHIRGARLGGATSGENLVLGTYSANSEMILYEHGILELSKRATPDCPLHVTWDYLPGPHGVRVDGEIRISWAAPKGLPDPKDPEFVHPALIEGSATFATSNARALTRVHRDAAWDPTVLMSAKPRRADGKSRAKSSPKRVRSDPTSSAAALPDAPVGDWSSEEQRGQYSSGYNEYGLDPYGKDRHDLHVTDYLETAAAEGEGRDFDENGFDRFGYDRNDRDRYGFDMYGNDKHGIHMTDYWHFQDNDDGL